MTRYRWLMMFTVLVLAALACQGGGNLSGTPTVVPSTPVGSYEAADAIKTYANDVLGLTITNVIAGGVSGEISLPVVTQEGVDAAIELAGTTYLGFWSEGLASVSLGVGTISGDMISDLQDASLGLFSIRRDVQPPQTAAEALRLIEETYPALAGLPWKEEPVATGFGFSAGRTESLNFTGARINLTGTVVSAGVNPGAVPNRAFVWTAVAAGQLATPFTQP